MDLCSSSSLQRQQYHRFASLYLVVIDFLAAPLVFFKVQARMVWTNLVSFCLEIAIAQYTCGSGGTRGFRRVQEDGCADLFTA